MMRPKDHVAGDAPASLRLKDLPADARPRERLLESGPAVLSDVELLAILLGSGSKGETAVGLASRLLSAFGGTGTEAIRALGRARPEELARFHGLGPAKAARLLAACELARRSGAVRATFRPKVNGPEDLVLLVGGRLRDELREHALVIWLDGRQQVVGWEAVSIGSLSETVVHPREVYREAIRKGAASIALVHNHPSGDSGPSRDDRELTRRLIAVGELVGIPLLDHVVLGDGNFYSFRSEPELWDSTPSGLASVGET